MLRVLLILLLPFFGTAIGAAGVLIPEVRKKESRESLLGAFAAGVMTAACFWSLILPAIDRASGMGVWRFVPALSGIWAGVLFLLLLDHLIPHLLFKTQKSIGRNTLLVIAVAIHNFPEGMAVGAAAALWLLGDGTVSFGEVISLSAGIAIQNIPEGAIISMPLRASGRKRKTAFGYGVLSGAVEPIGSVLTLLLAWILIPALPYFLCFAAGAMLYVVVKELIPDGGSSDGGVLSFCIGFTLMMTLDVALG